ncbi:MAG: hypothetical protein V4543_03740 [Bacteroidota bacterium]
MKNRLTIFSLLVSAFIALSAHTCEHDESDCRPHARPHGGFCVTDSVMQGDSGTTDTTKSGSNY